ncbi:hypothetical protein F5Y02DRAFT_413863 [Annulohypoxylon stygium]|nr:hypothetical protein F5Y02DRAFT_413863 [Annulohypoxylon stygium]
MSSPEEAKNGDQGLHGLLLRYQQYQADSERTHQLIKDLLIHAEKTETRLRQENNLLRHQLSDAHLDLKDAVKAQKDMQGRIDDIKVRVGHVPVPNPYVAVLIDGDGLVFKEHLIKQGHNGGQVAAQELEIAIANKSSQLGHTNAKIVTKVIADVQALAQDLTKNGFIPNEQALLDFVAGFSQTSPNVDFVDVGYGKERVAAKIFGCAQFHLRNSNCKQVIMGVGHDSGYRPYLEELMRTEDTMNRITILEGVPTVQAILSLRIDILYCRHLFRTERIMPKLPESPTSCRSPTPTPGTSYAAIAQTKNAPPPPEIKLPIHLKKPAPPAHVTQFASLKWNPGPRGLDKPINIKLEVMDSLKKKTGDNKLCNNHFLRGPCVKGADCVFEHDYNPTAEEKKVIAFFARLNPCALGQGCVVQNCIYGHHCPSVVNGVCIHPKCKYAIEDHPPGTKFKHPRFSE